MKILSVGLLLAVSTVTGLAADSSLDQYNVTWTSPSKNAAGSMPLGNGEVGLNLWVEEDGDLLFYISRTDAWSECNRLLKLGKIRVSLSPNPFTAGTKFRQELRLRNGRVEITAGPVTLQVFVDANRPVIYVTGRSDSPVTVRATLENWRTEKRALKGEELASSWTMQGAPDSMEIWEAADIIPDKPANAIVWYHRNEFSFVPHTWRHQGLIPIADKGIDPLLHCTFGGWMTAKDFVKEGATGLRSGKALNEFTIKIATHAAQLDTPEQWQKEVEQIVTTAPTGEEAATATARWWNEFWSRSWVFVEGDENLTLPASARPLQLGVDSQGGSRFGGEIAGAIVRDRALPAPEIAKLAATKPQNATNAVPANFSPDRGFTVAAWIKPSPNEAGRIFDKITAGGSDGFLLDTHPGLSLRLIVGSDTITKAQCLTPGEWQHIAATVDAASGAKCIYLNGQPVTGQGRSDDDAVPPSRVTQAYILQRWMTACAGRGNYPIKFNGSIFTVDPEFTGGPKFNADWRRWGDCYWWQNTRFPYFPMIARGDFDQLKPLFRMYEAVTPLCKARAKLYHNVDGVYFPETMTIFGTYANRDYGWNREGRQPNEVLSPWWQYSWQQGLELVALMLDYYEHTEDAKFLADELIPMARDVLSYYDTRFKRDAAGKLIISPTQAVETYWHDVTNDTCSVAGLIDVTDRLLALPADRVPKAEREFWTKMKAATPALPVRDGRVMPAKAFSPNRCNVENPELYAIWPFRLLAGGRPNLDIGIETFRNRHEKASFGWQYDGQCAAQVGLTDEARRILLGKIRNSHPNHRFPAMWGPNYDWLPDQDHGNNILLTLQHMLLQTVGDKIHVLPAWPKVWNVSFKFHAPKNTTIEGVYRAGKLEQLKVTPESRRKDVVLPQ